MSRIASRPIQIPEGVQLSVDGAVVTARGKLGENTHTVHPTVEFSVEGGVLQTRPANSSRHARAMAGTTRVLLQNLVTGVSDGFERRLLIIGTGYRAQTREKVLNLLLGFSHPVDFPIPEGITIETPSQTEIVVRGVDKQQVGQVAANIRAWRPPEPYKGKGVRYATEHVVSKEAKKS